MPQIIQMLNLNIRATAHRRRRIWVDGGAPMIVGREVIFQLFFDAYDETYIPNVLLQGPGVEFRSDLPMDAWLDMSAWAGMMAIPRAAEVNPHGRIKRVLMEFVALREDVRFELLQA